MLVASILCAISFRACLVCIVQRQHAEAVLLQFRQHPEAWTRVDTILSESALAQTRYLALQVRDIWTFQRATEAWVTASAWSASDGTPGTRRRRPFGNRCRL